MICIQYYFKKLEADGFKGRNEHEASLRVSNRVGGVQRHSGAAGECATDQPRHTGQYRQQYQ